MTDDAAFEVLARKEIESQAARIEFLYRHIPKEDYPKWCAYLVEGRPDQDFIYRRNL
jgi:hypothetical protein